MNPTVRVALLGFTNFERSHIEAGLQPGDEPGRHYRVAETLAACNLAVANADDELAVAQVVEQGRLASTVMLGATPRAGAAAQLPRPTSLVHLLRALDQLVNSAPPMSAAVQRVQAQWGRLLAAGATEAIGAAPAAATAALPAGPQAAVSATAAMPLIQARPPQREAAPAHPLAAAANGAQALVVVGNEEDGQQLASQLTRHGYQVHQLRDHAQALEHLTRQRHDLVILATNLDGLDGFHACRTIKGRPYPANRPAPPVIMLLERDSAVDEVRAEMAQADGCLSKPLLEQQLAQLLNRLQPPADDGWQRTRAGGHSSFGCPP